MSHTSNPSRRRSTSIQFVGALTLMGLSIVQGVILIPLYLSHLGKEVYGAWVATASTVTLLGMADLGVTAIVSQRAGAYCGAEDFNSLGSLIACLFVFISGVSVIILVAGLWVAPWLPEWVGLSGAPAFELANALRVALFDVVLMLFVFISGGVLFGLQRPGAHMAGMILGYVLGLIITVYLLLSGRGVVALAIGLITRSMTALPVNLCALWLSLRHKLRRQMLRFDSAVLLDLLRAALWLGPAKTTETFLPQVNNIITVKFLGPVAVTILAVTRKAADIVTMVCGRFSASFLSGLAHLYGEGNEQRYMDVVKPLFRVTIYMAVLGMSAVLLFNGNFIRLWVGKDLYGGWTLTLLICIYGVVKVPRAALYNVIFSRNGIRLASAASIAESIIQVAAGIFLIRVWGLPGLVLAAILAVVAAVLIQTIGLLSMLKVRYHFSFPPLLKVLAVALVPSLVAVLVKNAWHLESWNRFLACVAGYLCTAFAMVVSCEPLLFDYCRRMLRRRKAITA